jgi:hypothetical protein
MAFVLILGLRWFYPRFPLSALLQVRPSTTAQTGILRAKLLFPSQPILGLRGSFK